MSPGIYMLTILVLPVTAVIVFAMKYASSYAAARAKITEQSNLRALIAGNANQLSQISIALKTIEDTQERQSQTLASIYAMLREVG